MQPNTFHMILQPFSNNVKALIDEKRKNTGSLLRVRVRTVTVSVRVSVRVVVRVSVTVTVRVKARVRVGVGLFRVFHCVFLLIGLFMAYFSLVLFLSLLTLAVQNPGIFVRG